jgi:hypothetical protein
MPRKIPSRQIREIRNSDLPYLTPIFVPIDTYYLDSYNYLLPAFTEPTGTVPIASVSATTVLQPLVTHTLKLVLSRVPVN